MMVYVCVKKKQNTQHGTAFISFKKKLKNEFNNKSVCL